MRIIYQLCFFLFFLFSWFLACAQSGKSTESPWWPEIGIESRPWTRWWWMGSAVDSGNIERLLFDYSEKGIGGVEITPIYGVRGEEENYLDFLSREWVEVLRFTIKKAGEAGMGVDMNTGTGWPFGGPQVRDEYAAKHMQIQRLGNLSQGKINQFVNQRSRASGEELLALTACNSAGDRINLLKTGGKIGPIKQKGLELIAVTQKNTGQQVKRAAPGGEGLVLNHFSGQSTRQYLDRFSEAFQDNPGVRAFFNDSYELSDASSSFELFPAFEAIKGYDLALYTSEMGGKGNLEDIARLKADYRDVLGTMLLENFTGTWKLWAENLGALTKSQAHGSPGNLIDLYAEVDIPELETFHATHFPFLQDFMEHGPAKHTESNRLFRKFASSAAHMKGSNLVSCEVFTWLNEHFHTPLYQCKPEIDELFVQGVTHLFFHGTAYSPVRAAWPGWIFYASMHLEPNNPQWDHMFAMNTYIARCQSVLQAGRHTNDFLVFWSPDDYNHDAAGLEKKLTLHNSENWVCMPEIDYLLDQGYQFDFISDRIISGSKVHGSDIVTYDRVVYQCIVVPELDRIKLATFKRLLQLAEKGASIVFSKLPSKVSGFKNYSEKEKELAELARSLQPAGETTYHVVQRGKGKICVGNIEYSLKELGIERETLIDHKIKSISRKTENGVYYFIANHEKEDLDKWVKFKHSASHALLMDPMTGEICLAEMEAGAVHLELKAGASTIIYFTDKDVDGLRPYVYSQYRNITELSHPWKLRALKGGPELFQDTILPKLTFWTDLSENIYQHFAGTCEYSTNFHVEALNADNYLLRFEKVEASARIYINHREVATLWSFPFEASIGKYLKQGENSLRVEVCNLGANRIRFLDQQGIDWKKFHNINVVDLDYKSLDAKDWGVLPSGLSGKVELIELTD
jgi:hypothetical protein